METEEIYVRSSYGRGHALWRYRANMFCSFSKGSAMVALVIERSCLVSVFKTGTFESQLWGLLAKSSDSKKETKRFKDCSCSVCCKKHLLQAASATSCTDNVRIYGNSHSQWTNFLNGNETLLFMVIFLCDAYYYYKLYYYVYLLYYCYYFSCSWSFLNF